MQDRGTSQGASLESSVCCRLLLVLVFVFIALGGVLLLGYFILFCFIFSVVGLGFF